MKIYFESLGCARNQVDSEILMGRLKESGNTLVNRPETADAIVVNTCSFIEDAADESIDTILALAEYKKTGACRFLVAIGCLPERYQDDIADSLPEVDLFLGTGALHLLPTVVKNIPHTTGVCFDDPDRSVFTEYAARLSLELWPPSAYVKIAEGCDRQCTYCIIPRLRGRQKSRPMENIISEAAKLADAGVKELVLVAQETSFYGKDLDAETDLSGLLAALSGLKDDIRIRVLYGHPRSTDDKLIKTIASHANLCSYFDIPIQHASSRVLKRMGRAYTTEDLHRVVDNIRDRIPDVALRTTVMTGFPGETDEDFRILMDFLESVRFHHVGAFVYSDADDLPSHHLPDPVPEKTAKQRYDRVMALQQEVSREIHQGYIGTVCRVLIEERPEENLFVGRTDFQAPEVDGVVFIQTDQLVVGRFADIIIVDALEYDLMGETV